MSLVLWVGVPCTEGARRLRQTDALFFSTVRTSTPCALARRLGLGVGYVPEMQVKEDIAAGRLVPLNLNEPPHEAYAVLAWKAKNRGQALHFLLERLRKTDA